jgi:bis(5'-nucleosyl)-tetraphosphatase (symmetrical)
MRFCTANGKLDLSSKGPPDAPGGRAAENPAYRPWFSHENRRAAGDLIVFGHWAALNGETGDSRTVGLDTGCVWGGAMTLYCLETGERVQAPCAR